MTAADVRALGAWVVVAAVFVVVAVTAWPSAEAVEGPLEDPVAFAVESYAQVCAQCHGLAGQGGTVPAGGREVPALVGNDDLSAAYLDLVMLTGRMPPAGDPFDNRDRDVVYTDAERAAMVAWMTAEFDIPGELPAISEDGSVSRGLEVFARNCAHCHGNAGAGGTAGQQAFTPQVSNLPDLAVAEAIRVGPFEMPAFSEDVIPDDDVDAVVAYLDAVSEEGGTPLFGLVELNPVFASGFVGVLALALIGSLLYIAGRPVPFEELVAETVDVDPPGGAKEDQDDPAGA